MSTCIVCGRRLTAMVCPSCGTPATLAATPVAAPTPPPAPSLQPAGTAAPASATAEAPLPPAQPAKAETQQRNPGYLVGLLAGIFLVVLAIIGILIYLTASGTVHLFSAAAVVARHDHGAMAIADVPTTRPAFTATFASPDQRFAMTYPADWQATTRPLPGGTAYFFHSGSSNGAIVLYSLTMPIPPALYGMVLNSYLKSTRDDSISRSLRTVSSGSNQWRSLDSTFSWRGIPFRAVLYGLNAGKNGYIIMHQAPRSHFSMSDTLFFRPSLASFILASSLIIAA